MITASVLKHILSDDESLLNYMTGGVVTISDIKRRMFLKARNENRAIPDHHYRMVENKSFRDIDNIGDAVRIGLFHLAKGHLHIRNNRIYVKQEKQGSWQELITFIPPLALQAAFLHIEAPLTDSSESGIMQYFKKYILPNFKHTALPYPFIPQLEEYLRDEKGLHDLHVHLNGAIETDLAWQDYLIAPEKIYDELKKAYDNNNKVKEQFEQESHLLSPHLFYKLLKAARQVRNILQASIFTPQHVNLNTFQLNHLLETFVNDSESTGPASKFTLPESDLTAPGQIAKEALLYILLFKKVAIEKNDSISSFFHFYLQILGLTNRLLVQQTHQYGFEQFQKHTLNGLREYSEKTYVKRFFQMHGNELRNISFLEGRFSPKDTEAGFISMLHSINEGWEALCKRIKENTNGEIKDPVLKLIAHFIKRPDTNTELDIRYEFLRRDIWNRATVLSFLIKKNNIYKSQITGIDAAASEFDTPPEVFGPIFRMLRREGFQHFTFHAGEDFHHIVSGLRAVYEAVIFTAMECGNRIGHATATGLSPKQWVAALGDQILITQGEWLDNLIFVYHLVVTHNIESLRKQLPYIANEIQKNSLEIYQGYYPLKALEDAWVFRKYCPMHLLSLKKEDARLLSLFDEAEWEEGKKESLGHHDALQLLQKYHQKDYRRRYEKIILISTTEILSVEDIEILQKGVLAFLHKKEIVIETLPTSNVRIGHHPNLSTYHLWNWIKWEEEGFSIPPIVVGTDDTGIFATSIYNEYANIYCYLTGEKKATHSKAMSIIEKLNKNSKIYRFS